MPADLAERLREIVRSVWDFKYLRGKKLFGCDARLSSGDPPELAAAVHAYTCDRCTLHAWPDVFVMYQYCILGLHRVPVIRRR